MDVPCPLCAENITIPPKPVWLPAINEALRKIVQEEVAGKIGTATARAKLRDAIIASGYDAGTARVEPESPDDLLSDERLDLAIGTNVNAAWGWRGFIQDNSPGAVEAFPAQELFRGADRMEPRNWDGTNPSIHEEKLGVSAGGRWLDAAAAAGDDDAARMLTENERMIALLSSEIWDRLGDLWDDSLGNPSPPYAFQSGMDVRGISRDEAVALGLMDEDEQIMPRRGLRPPQFIPIEDDRITEYLWNKPQVCDHCGEKKPLRLLHLCDDCGGSICRECIAEGCKCPEPEPSPEPRDAIQCCSRAVDEMAGFEFPFEQDVAERVVYWYDRAFEFGFAAHHRDIEARAHRMLGEALESLGERERALREYELALEKDPQVGVKKRIASLRKESTKA